MTDELRKRYSIKEGVRGVIVTRVDPNSPASDKRIAPGDVIVEVQQEPVTTPDAMTKRLDALMKEGKKSALLLVANAQGDVRFAQDRWNWITMPAGMLEHWVAAGEAERTRLATLPFDALLRRDFGIPGRPDLLPPGSP